MDVPIPAARPAAGRVHGVVDIVFAVVLAATLGLWSVTELWDPASEVVFTGQLAGRIPEPVTVAVVTAHVAIGARRTHPGLSFVAVSISVGVLLLTSAWVLLPTVMLFLVSSYSYFAHGGRQAPMIGVAVAAVGTVVVIVAGLAVAGRATPDEIGFLLVRYLPFVVAAGSLGMFRRVRMAYVAALEERARRAEADREERDRRVAVDERARIAREMHDVVAHVLAVIISQADGGRYAGRADPERAVSALTTIAGTGRRALADVRGLLQVLRPEHERPEHERPEHERPEHERPEHERPGSGEGHPPQPTLDDLPELLQRVRNAGLSVRLVEHGQRHDLGPAGELAVYRLAQEALTNTMRHGGEGVSAEVDLRWTADGLEVTAVDDGTVGEPGPAGHGLVGMRERVGVVGGSVTAAPAPDGGFAVRAWLPRRGGAA